MYNISVQGDKLEYKRTYDQSFAILCKNKRIDRYEKAITSMLYKNRTRQDAQEFGIFK